MTNHTANSDNRDHKQEHDQDQLSDHEQEKKQASCAHPLRIDTIDTIGDISVADELGDGHERIDSREHVDNDAHIDGNEYEDKDEPGVKDERNEGYGIGETNGTNEVNATRKTDNINGPDRAETDDNTDRKTAADISAITEYQPGSLTGAAGDLADDAPPVTGRGPVAITHTPSPPRTEPARTGLAGSGRQRSPLHAVPPRSGPRCSLTHASCTLL